MNTQAASREAPGAGRELDPLDALLTPEERSTVTVEKHAAFREAISTRPAADPLDELVEEIRQAEFEGKGATP
jgi:hypothetical protein